MPVVTNETILALEVAEDWKTLVPPKGGRTWGRWKHQYKGFKFVQRYFNTSRCEKHPRAALVRMPTGSGKTGIMALAAAYGRGLGDILIVVPSTALATQVSKAISREYWLRLKKRPPLLPTVHHFIPSSLASDLDRTNQETRNGRQVFVCTTTTLAILNGDEKARWEEQYRALQSRITFVIVDEGHREPAPTWARAIRAFHRPTVLFSATPYRNDIRFFNLGRGDGAVRYRFIFRVQDAFNKQIIRQVEFVKPLENWSTRKDSDRARHFVAALRSFYETHISRVDPEDPELGPAKVIVRCGSRARLDSVRDQLFRHFNKRTVLAVHDQYDRDDSLTLTFHDVPDPRDPEVRKTVFWLHQDKLTEGIDNSSIVGVAFETAFGNSRSLVQQIGRIIRNPSHDASRRAFVLSDPCDNLDDQWKGYREYERMKPPIVGPEEIVERFLKSLPKWFYSGNTYRRRFDLNLSDQALAKELRFTAAAQVYAAPTGQRPSNLDEVAEDLEDQMGLHDYAMLRDVKVAHRPNLRIFLSVRVAETTQLSATNFFDVYLAVSVFYRTSCHAFFQGPFNAAEIMDRHEMRALRSSEIQRVLGPHATIQQIAAVNTDIGDHAPRRRAVGARNVESSGLMLTDHAYILTNAVGNRPNFGRRAVGLLTSRVVDAGVRELDIDGFCDWAEAVSADLATTAWDHSLFRRFAEEEPAPEMTEAKSVLMDLGEFFENVQEPDGFDNDDDVPFNERFDATAAPVDDHGNFDITIGALKYPASVTYRRGYFNIQSKELDEKFKAKGDEKRKPSTLVSTHRSLRIVTTERLLYTNGRFFRPGHLWGPDAISNLEFVQGIQALASIEGDEKGKKMVMNGARYSWDPRSLFGMLDNPECSIYKEVDFDVGWLVCDDLGTEFADFLAIDRSGKRVAVVHCKASKPGPTSPSGKASSCTRATSAEGAPQSEEYRRDDEVERKGSVSAQALQEVTAQAVKNLSLFDAVGGFTPDRVRKWNSFYRGDQRLPRLRYWPSKGLPPDARAFGDAFLEALRRTDVRRELWIVVGNSISAQAVRAVAQSQSPPPYHAIQLLYLLNSLNAHTSHFGGILRVFVSP